MRRIRDHAYLFSIASDKRGRIIACRTSRGCGAVGQSLISHLGIDEGEINFINSKMGFGSDSLFFVSNMEGTERPAVIFRFFSYSTSLALAVVFDLPLAAVSRNYREGMINYSCASDRFLSFSEKSNCTEEELDDAYLYFSEVFGDIAPLYNLRLQYVLPSRGSLKSAAACISHFVGVDLDCLTLDLPINGGYLNAVGNVFSGPMCTATLLLSALLARDLSPNRKLSVNVLWGYRSFYLLCSYTPTNDERADALDFLTNIAYSRSVEMRTTYSEEQVQIKLSPFYIDTGIEEVKEYGRYRRLTDLEIMLYNYPEITFDQFLQ